MGLFDHRDNARDLTSLLDRERRAILNGDFAALRRLLPEKERLIGLTANDRTIGERLIGLRQKAARNHALLEAAAHGIRSVIGGLSSARGPAPELETYDQTGRRSTCSERAGSMERRY